MTEQATTGAVQQSVTVPLTQEQAFELFVDRLNDWWPKGGTHSLTKAATFYLEAREDGRWGEQDTDGEYRPWGRVLSVDRPRRIVMAWQLTPDFAYDADPAKQTEVEVNFEPEGAEATKVTLEHRGFEVWGEKGPAMRASVGSEGGWRELLNSFAEVAAG
jgi:uncharacterized protein YndB with AHSA1/START domain